MNNQTVQIESVEEILAAVEAAKATVEHGEQKARRAKALLSQAEKLEQDLEQVRQQAEQEIATAQDALTEAEGLRAVLGDEFVAGAQAVVERVEREWNDRIRKLTSQLEQIEADLRALDEDPELEAFLALTEHERRERAARREVHREEFERRLDTLRSGALIGEGEDAMRILAEEARAEGFESLAAQADRAAGQAAHIRHAREKEAAEKLRREFIRWCSRHTKDGHIVLVLSWDERQAAQLRPRPAASGRLYFEVVDVTGSADVPEKYDDFPASSRTWKAKKWTEAEGFTLDQTRFLHALVSGIRGREANALNAALAKKVETNVKAEASVDAQPQVAAETPKTTEPEPETTVDLPGLPAAVAGRLHKVGLTSRQAVREAADDETTFLALPGIGKATLMAVQKWLAEEDEDTTATSRNDDSKDPSGGLEDAKPGIVEAEPEAAEVEPEIVVAGISMDDDMSGIRLTEWRGLANAILTPLLRTGRIGRMELLIEETHNGDGPEVGILASWDGDMTEVTVSGNGDRSCRIQAMRQLVAALRA